METAKRYFIDTFGCQANIRDSQAMAGTLDALGFLPTSDYRKADVVILNTCSVRQKSEDKVFGWGWKLGASTTGKEAKYAKKGKQTIFVTGCMVGSAKGERKRYTLRSLKERMPWANYFLAPEEEYQIPQVLVKEGLVDEWAVSTVQGAGMEKAFAKGKNNEKAQNSTSKRFSVKPNFANTTEWAYVNISQGCDNFCTFCVVPYARGEEVSRPKEEIISEIKNLVSRGFSKIMLVGQNVNSWGLDREKKFKLRTGSDEKIPFAQLLRDVHNIPGVEKITFISSNPFDFTRDLIETLRLPKIDRYLHIAIQSGDNDVLKRMNRRHTVEEFTSLLLDIVKEVPDMTFGTDIIVGFPGETEEQFLHTVQLMREIKFVVAFISMYSPRIGTIAQKNFSDDVPLKEKKRRHAYVTHIWKQTLEK